MCLNISDPKQIATIAITAVTAIKMQQCRAAKAKVVRVGNGHECVAYVSAAAAATVK